ncbi:MAG: ribose-5-phosphate isomerase RpiA [Calditrichaeota bacterium]|nr:MAG: ribose-5-phosphate isomerase RpiA [Calditrichota bacterium]
MNQQQQWKRMAAEAAIAEVEEGMVVGLGTGSTAAFAIKKLGELIQKGQLKRVVGIPSSLATEALARQCGIPLVSFEDRPVIDLTIDGADQVDPALNLIKGGGGALLREKILAQNSRQVLIVVDQSKLCQKLGEGFALPVEVLPFGWFPEKLFLASLGAQVTLRRGADGQPFLTDQQNYILDCLFPGIDDPQALDRQLKGRAAILENGLFLNLASRVIVAGEEGPRVLQPA